MEVISGLVMVVTAALWLISIFVVCANFSKLRAHRSGQKGVPEEHRSSFKPSEWFWVAVLFLVVLDIANMAIMFWMG